MGVSSVLHTTRSFSHVPTTRLYRIVGMIVVFLWGGYMLASLRTMQFGEDGRSLRTYVICALVWVFLPAVLVFLSQDFRKTVRRAGVLTLLVIVVVFAWVNLEEARIDRKITQTCSDQQPVECADLTGASLVNGEWLVYERAWPFQNHTMAYRWEVGWSGDG
jgi:hypothetical protein